MSLLDREASEAGIEPIIDWRSTPWLKLPSERGQSLDLVIVGTDRAFSENTFQRKVGPPEETCVPAYIHKDVLLVQIAGTSAGLRLGVKGLGLVTACQRAGLPASWPVGADALPEGERDAPVIMPAPMLVRIECTGKRELPVGATVGYQVTRYNFADPGAVVRKMRLAAASQATVAPAAAPETTEADDANAAGGENPF